jgi:hypothetical protein
VTHNNGFELTRSAMASSAALAAQPGVRRTRRTGLAGRFRSAATTTGSNNAAPSASAPRSSHRGGAAMDPRALLGSGWLSGRLRYSSLDCRNPGRGAGKRERTGAVPPAFQGSRLRLGGSRGRGVSSLEEPGAEQGDAAGEARAFILQERRDRLSSSSRASQLIPGVIRANG